MIPIDAVPGHRAHLKRPQEGGMGYPFWGNQHGEIVKMTGQRGVKNKHVQLRHQLDELSMFSQDSYSLPFSERTLQRPCDTFALLFLPTSASFCAKSPWKNRPDATSIPTVDHSCSPHRPDRKNPRHWSQTAHPQAVHVSRWSECSVFQKKCFESGEGHKDYMIRREWCQFLCQPEEFHVPSLANNMFPLVLCIYLIVYKAKHVSFLVHQLK